MPKMSGLPTATVKTVAVRSRRACCQNTVREANRLSCQARQKYRITANIVPVWSITNSSVISGAEGFRPMSLAATITWAVLETGSNSAKPCTTARMTM